VAAHLTPWEGPPPSDSELRAAFRAEGLSPSAWSNGPGDRYGEHTHSFDKVLYCSRGSIVFIVDGTDVAMAAGDRLDLPAGTPHAALVGPEGCTCLEAHRGL
jgi:quercetin dioxygenase-like cupin family protein